ncbi:uncharacterized protein LOC144139226 [Haemaphysalis longicornis]
MAHTATRFLVLAACLVSFSAARRGHKEGRSEGQKTRYPAPKECPWFSEVLRNCSVEPSQQPKYREALTLVGDGGVRTQIQICMIKNSHSVPQRIYCTDDESVTVLRQCFKEGWDVRNKTDERDPNAGIEFFDEILDCMTMYHYGEPEGFVEYRRRF